MAYVTGTARGISAWSLTKVEVDTYERPRGMDRLRLRLASSGNGWNPNLHIASHPSRAAGLERGRSQAFLAE